jgi:hypothetical protein
MTSQSNDDVTRLVLGGHLTVESLTSALADLELRLGAGDKLLLLIDCREMLAYELGARHLFVEWNAKHRHRIHCVAILTSNRLWWMVIGAMRLASGQAMAAFADESAALAWLRR